MSAGLTQHVWTTSEWVLFPAKHPPGVSLCFTIEHQPASTDDEVDVDVTFQITAKGIENSNHCGKETLLLAEGDEGLSAGRKDGVQQSPLLKQQDSELRWDGEGNVISRGSSGTSGSATHLSTWTLAHTEQKQLLQDFGKWQT